MGPRFGANKADEPAKTIIQTQEPVTPIHTKRNFWDPESQRKVTYQERKEEKEAKKKEIFAKNVVNVLSECGIDVKPVKEVYSDNLVETMPLNSVSMKSVRYSDGLVNGCPCPELAAELHVDIAYVGNVIVLNGSQVHVGDIILVREIPAEIRCCCSAEVNGVVHLGVLADRLDFIQRLSSVGTLWRRSGLSQLKLFTKKSTFFLPTAWHVDAEIFTVIA